MANPFSKCKECGNMWPASTSGKDHPHLTTEAKKMQLKRKHRARKVGWSKPCGPRTNPAKGQPTTQGTGIRRRAYGPFYNMPPDYVGHTLAGTLGDQLPLLKEQVV